MFIWSPKPHRLKQLTVNLPCCQLGHSLYRAESTWSLTFMGTSGDNSSNLMLKNHETLQSSFCNISIPIFFTKLFPFSSSIDLPSDKKHNNPVEMKGSCCPRWALAALSCAVMTMWVFHDATYSLCDRCDCILSWYTWEAPEKCCAFPAHKTWLPSLSSSLEPNQNKRQRLFYWGGKEYEQEEIKNNM